MATEFVRRIRGTRVNLGREVREEWVKAQDICCEPLNFSDLDIGDMFILMPMPGDNSGHGGLLGGSYLFRKINPEPVSNIHIYSLNSPFRFLNALHVNNGGKIAMGDHQWVYRVL